MAIENWAARIVANGVDAADFARVTVLDEGSHGCANVSYRHRPYAADWMARQLGR
jgi:hypothetical protein